MRRRWLKDLGLWVSVALLTMPACTCQQSQEQPQVPAAPQSRNAPGVVGESHGGWSTRQEPAFATPNVETPDVKDEAATDVFAQQRAAAARGQAANAAEDDGDEESPSVSVDADIDDGGAPLIVHFMSSVSPLPPSARFIWDFGDGGGATGDPNPTHTYGTPGDYEATLRVVWPGGSEEDSVSISVEEEAFDVEIEADPTSGDAPLHVRFRAAADTDMAPSRLRFEWDLGGGVKGAGQTSEHTYTSPGSYPVTVVVTNLAGQHGSASTEIEVEAPE